MELLSTGQLDTDLRTVAKELELVLMRLLAQSTFSGNL